MNRQDIKAIHREILLKIPGLASHKRLLLLRPMNGILRAIHFDPSAFSKDDFYLATCVMPLCVPADTLSLLFGTRLNSTRTPGGWSRRDRPDLIEDLIETIRSQALPFLEGIQSLHDVARLARQYWRNPHAPKEAAFALARAEDYGPAISIIDELLPRLDCAISWERSIFDEASVLRHLLLNDPCEAQARLRCWEDYTINKLGLEAFR